MKKSIALAFVALGALSAVPSAQAASSRLIIGGPLIANPKGPFFAYRFQCAALGPVEFPQNVQIWNGANFTTPAGLRVRWTKAGNGPTGIAILPALAPGKGIVVKTDLLGPGNGCLAKVL
jgi:hypothetical protein